MVENIEDVQIDVMAELQQDLVVLMDIIVQQTVDNLDLYFEKGNTEKFESLVDKAMKYKNWKIINIFMEMIKLKYLGFTENQQDLYDYLNNKKNNWIVIDL